MDNAVVGLMDPAHVPYVHNQWWWRPPSTGRKLKEKRFVPRERGWAIERHAPASNSLAYRMLFGGDVTTEISFMLPGFRWEVVENAELAPVHAHLPHAGRVVRGALESLEMPPLVKTTGSRGLHVYVPIVRGPTQKDVWTFAKALAVELASRHAALMTAEYKVAKRPARPRPHRLQPERVGTDAGVDVFGATASEGDGVDSRHLEGDRSRRSDRGLQARQRPPANREGRRPVEAAAAGPRTGRSRTLSGRDPTAAAA